MIPAKITILSDYNSRSFTLITQEWNGDLNVHDFLSYDEMLGAIARNCCPTTNEGAPSQFIGRPLFLADPRKTTVPNKPNHVSTKES